MKCIILEAMDTIKVPNRENSESWRRREWGQLWIKCWSQHGVVLMPSHIHPFHSHLHSHASLPGSHLALNTSLVGHIVQTWQVPDSLDCCCMLEGVQGKRWRCLTYLPCVRLYYLVSLWGMFDTLAPSFGTSFLCMTTCHILAMKTMWCRRKNTGSGVIDWTPLTSHVTGATLLNLCLQNKDNGAYFTVLWEANFLKSPNLTAVTKLPSISLNNKYLFLIVLEAGLSPRSRHQQIQCLAKAHFLVHRCCLLAISAHGGRVEGAVWSLV